MKRLLFLSILVFAPFSNPARAQNTAAELALERRANEERFKILSARVTSIEETQEDLSKRLTALERSYNTLSREIDKIKDDVGHASSRQASKEDLKTLWEKLQEIEKKREADNKLIRETIKDLAKLPLPAATSPKPAAERNETIETHEYVVQPGNMVMNIIDAYNDEYAKQGLGRITLDQVRKANPDINVDRILPKQVIRIPIPPKK